MGSYSLSKLASTQLFQPDRYFKTRGLSIQFGGDNKSKSGPGSVLVSPTVIRNRGDNNTLSDIYVNKQKKYWETSIDD